MNKKLVFSMVAGLGMLVAQNVLAVAYDPSVKITANSQLAHAGDVQVTAGNFGVPCDSTNSVEPCMRNIMFKSIDDSWGRHSLAPWFALMFILTVAMVWAILLLVIGILWQVLKKYKHEHHHHMHEHHHK